MLAVRSALIVAKGPCRQLDALVAATLSPDMIWQGRPLKSRHLTMAFTRGVENADRFIQIALPRWDWTVGSYCKDGNCHATIWAPDDGSSNEGQGATPALAILIAGLSAGIEEGGWPILRAAAEGRRTP